MKRARPISIWIRWRLKQEPNNEQLCLWRMTRTNKCKRHEMFWLSLVYVVFFSLKITVCMRKVKNYCGSGALKRAKRIWFIETSRKKERGKCVICQQCATTIWMMCRERESVSRPKFKRTVWAWACTTNIRKSIRNAENTVPILWM